MFTLPNNLTLLRIAMVPAIVVLLHIPSRLTCLVASAVFLFAAFTDLVDGFVARRYNMISNVGKFLDPLADKLLISSVLVVLVDLQWAPGWVAIVIIAREFLVTGLRAIASDFGMVIAADSFGKAKTILQSIALTLLTLHYPWFGLDPVPTGNVILYLALAVTVFSGGNYLYNFYVHWLDRRQEEE